MRLALLQDHLRNGGTEQQTLAIAEGLAQRGVDVHLIIFRRGGVLEPQATRHSVSSTGSSSVDPHDTLFTLHFLKQGFLKTDWFAPGLTRLLKRISPDAVLPMGRMANCHAGLLAKRPRSYTLYATLRTGRSLPFLYRRALRHTDHIVANSQEALHRIATEHGIHRPDTSTVIYNGCIRDFETTIPKVGSGLVPRSSHARLQPSALNLQPSKPDTLHLVSISMFRPQKKQIRLIRICSQLPEEINWKLTLAGDGPTRATCQAEAQRLGLANRIHFPGLLKDPRSLYADADIALHASDRESLPNFLVEAQMSGLPVIAYDVNGVRETFIDQKSGILIPHRDEPAFLAALQKLATDKDLQDQMATAARAHAQKNFSLESQTAAYHRLLEHFSYEQSLFRPAQP